VLYQIAACWLKGLMPRQQLAQLPEDPRVSQRGPTEHHGVTACLLEHAQGTARVPGVTIAHDRYPELAPQERDNPPVCCTRIVVDTAARVHCQVIEPGVFD
jgi:hypothetical protein